MCWLNCLSIAYIDWNWLNYMLLLRCVDLGMKLIMWLLCELLLKSDELKVNLMNCLRLNDLLTIWLNCVCCWEWCESRMWWDEKWDVEMLIMKEWIELLRLWIWDCDELDWIVELCELHVFDGNELVVLNGWLICGKPRKKEMMRLKAYAIWWNEKLGNVKLHQMIDIEKDAQKGKRLILKKMPRKGKWLIWKKMPKWEKNVMRMMKMVYLMLIFLFRQLNELSILIEIVWIDVMIGEYIEKMEYVVYY